MKRLIISTLLLALPICAAIPANSVWEVRTTGSDTNGGAFVVGATGTDMSQFDNKNAASCTLCQSATVNISVADGVTAGTTTITSLTANFSAAIVGNVIYVAGGTGTITGAWYEVATFTNSTTVLVDRSTGLTTGTGVTVNIGGALATINQLATTLTAVATFPVKCFAKTGVGYTTATAIVLPSAGTPNGSGMNSELIGYTTTRGDGGMAVLTNTALTGGGEVVLFTLGAAWTVKYLTIDCASFAFCSGVALNNYAIFTNSKVLNMAYHGVNLVQTLSMVINSEIGPDSNAGTGANGVYMATRETAVWYSYIHDVGAAAIVTPSTSTFDIIGNIIDHAGYLKSTGNPEATCICAQGFRYHIWYNVIRRCKDEGILLAYTFVPDDSIIKGNIITENGLYGIKSTNPHHASWQWDGNAYYSNPTANRFQIDDTTGLNGVAPYTNTLDIVLTGLPYINAGTNFQLNNVSGQGMAIKAMAFFSWPGAASPTTTYGNYGVAIPAPYPTSAPIQ